MRKVLMGLMVGLFSISVWAAPVNVNTATAEEISKALSGIGLAKAQAIVAYREANGAFKQASDLTKVKGIGEKTIEKNLADILLEDKKP